jgi:hypothetical protein
MMLGLIIIYPMGPSSLRNNGETETQNAQHFDHCA